MEDLGNIFIRSELLLGGEAMDKLKGSRVIIFGIGGVGSYVAEILIRTGLGHLTLVDYDDVDPSNINRQIQATTKTIGMKKVQAMKERALEINPNLDIKTMVAKYSPENKDIFKLEDYDYIVDSIDMITGKISLVEEAKKHKVPIISSMGAGNKLDPTAFKVGDIYETSVCPLARVMRRELRKREIDSLKVVWSEEKSRNINLGDQDRRKAVPASIAFVPSVLGIILASEVIKDLIKEV